MTPGNDHNEDNAAYIHRYLAGELSHAEMHALEKRALDDPFLADAIEGYAQAKEEETDKALASVREALAASRGRLVPMQRPGRRRTWIMAAAASGLLLVGLSVSYLLLKPNRERAAIAQQPVVPADSANNTTAVELAPVAAERSKAANPVAAAAPPVIAQKEIKKRSDSSFDNPSVRPTTLAVRQASPAAPDSLQANSLQEVVVSGRKKNAVVTDDDKDVQADSETVARAVPLHSFEARIVDSNRTPMAFANIHVPSENLVTYADAQGRVRLVSPRPQLGIRVKSQGYSSQGFVLKKEMPADITLLEGRVAGLNIAKSRAAAAPHGATLVMDTSMAVAPVDSWNAYALYIANNLLLPGTDGFKVVHGDLVISFEVSADGSLANLQIQKSAGKAIDEAALKALREGPKWTHRDAADNRGQVRLAF